MLRDPAEAHKAAVGVREAGASGTDKFGVCGLRDVLGRLLNTAGTERRKTSAVELRASASKHAFAFDSDHGHATCAVSLCGRQAAG